MIEIGQIGHKIVMAVVEVMKGFPTLDLSRSSPEAVQAYRAFSPTWQHYLAHHPAVAILL